MADDRSTPASLPMMPWYPRDFRSSTLGWPLIARAVYRELLDASWDAGGLPTDEHSLRTICGVTAAQWRAAPTGCDIAGHVAPGRRRRVQRIRNK
jgi:hypothetical protein